MDASLRQPNSDQNTRGVLDFTRQFEGMSYKMIAMNCQNFVTEIILFACGYTSEDNAVVAVLGTIGTILF